MTMENTEISTPFELKPVAKRFVLHWGEMGTTWGVNRTVAQIHALLFVVGTPMNAEQITEVLGVARSNVSNSLKELQNWRLIRTVRQLGDRRDHFETITDVWQLFRTVVSERKGREFNPTIDVLAECIADEHFALESPDAQKRIRETHELMTVLSTWADEMLRLEPETLTKILRLGAKIQTLIRRDQKKGKTKPAIAKAD